MGMSANLSDLVDLLLRIRPYASIAHHLPGRVRLKIGLGVLGVLKGMPLDLRLADFRAFQGIGEVRVNMAALSAVVSYDPSIVPNDFWRQCLTLADADLREMVARVLRPL
ncbi:hypothetical protein CKO38_08645 [Rhodospirillum rubrum]|nr:hypothetical protein [Rhodospirillum rubrum]MBK1676736.1 hypothetical protein [Rhodospirillum rubrum]